MSSTPNTDRVVHLKTSHSIKLLFRLSAAGVLWLSMISLIVSMPGLSEAADVTLTPKLAVGGAYDDNVLFSNEDELSSSIFTVSPRVELDYESLLSNLWLRADWDILRYFDESDLDRTNQYYELRGSHRFKERWSASFDVDYIQDTSLNTYLQDIGRVIDRVQRDYFKGGGDVSYALTQRSGMGASYYYRDVQYDSDRYSDYDGHNVGLWFYQRLKSEVDLLSIGPNYYHRTNDQNEVDSYSLNVRWNRDWSSITRSKASIGGRYTQISYDDGTEDDNWGAVANCEITFEGLVNRTIFRYFHDLRTTADGDDVNVDNFILNYRHLLTERFSAGIDGRLVFSYNLLNQESDVNDTRYYWIEPHFSYQITRTFGISFKYRYQNNIQYQDDGDVTRERNYVWVQLYSSWPLKL